MWLEAEDDPDQKWNKNDTDFIIGDLITRPVEKWTTPLDEFRVSLICKRRISLDYLDSNPKINDFLGCKLIFNFQYKIVLLVLSTYVELFKTRPCCYPVENNSVTLKEAVNLIKGLIGKHYTKWKESDIIYYISKMRGSYC